MAYFDKYGVEFSDDRNILVKCPENFQGEYIIPEGVKCIGDGAFYECKKLLSVSIPNSVVCFGNNSFKATTCIISRFERKNWCKFHKNSTNEGNIFKTPSRIKEVKNQ